ncbi:OB-fold domain-containing protein [Nocardioides sp.]|uniref:Zn-ribbon domain-containing OB-fold protein n=1 Tax=Nocardioides sp. TaxID=35761 RepID=UPI00260B65EF|nr:OB-fold domain-containing protein [Nocardioides sp.]MCW2737951.1 hypothetical protein [Nocardioides sp.]
MSRPPRPEEIAGELFALMARTSRLHVQQCTECHRSVHPPRYFCPICGSARMAFVPLDGTGVVTSWTTVEYTVDPEWQPLVPYDVVVVELSEGPRVVALAQDFPRTPHAGAPVRVTVQPMSDAFVRYIARPESARAATGCGALSPSQASSARTPIADAPIPTTQEEMP